VRGAVCSLRGVYAMWDGLVVGARRAARRSTSAAVPPSRKHLYGVDMYPAEPVDVLADLRVGLPFADRSVDRVYAVHVLEHLVDLVSVMNELHRILADDGALPRPVPGLARRGGGG